MPTPTFLEEIETMPNLTATQSLEATDHLDQTLRNLSSVLKEIERGAMRGTEISKSLVTAWFQVDCFRHDTESDISYQELNVEATGNLHLVLTELERLLPKKTSKKIVITA